MTRWIAIITLPLALLFTACDGEPVTPEERAAADQIDAEDAGERPHKAWKTPDQRICEQVACTDEQRANIESIFAEHRPDHKRGERDAAQGDPALADKIRAGSLTTADLLASRPAERHPPAALLVALHGALEPAQRATLADTMLADGPQLFGKGGKHGKHGKHGKEGGKHAGKGEHAGKGKHGKLQKICEIAECTDEQRAAFKAAMKDQRAAGEADREGHRVAREAAATALADAFRGANFSAADLERFAAAMKPLHDAKAERKAAMLVDVLAQLTPEQRAKLADAVATKGLRALGGDHGKHGGKRGKRGAGKDRGANGPA
ncbi:MAG: Spy/CpxP family protein refolding chaperone [Nannocystis sp.]|nr:Spy/CpxP family protein refolding chaperone [Nannocystis sp.]